MGFKLKQPSGQPLRRMATMLREAPRYVQQEAANEIARGILKLIDQGFVSGADSYGTAWRPPKDGHIPPMIRSGKLRRSYNVKVVRTGSVGYSIIYALASQLGAGFTLASGPGGSRASLVLPLPALPEATKLPIA